jgi:hypoxanthine-guanine phosphoribosyltransferase
MRAAGVGSLAGGLLGTGRLSRGAAAAQPPPEHSAHAAHAMGTVGRVGTDVFGPTPFLRAWNFSDLPPAERATVYRETPRPDGSLLREYEMYAVDRDIEIAPGVFFPAWTYNGQVPGPTIRATEGDRIRVTFRNLGSHPHSIHFHGWHAPDMDGALPGQEVMPGYSFVYEFDAEPYGLHLYHCHTVPLRRHIHKGLYGAFIIDPRGGRPPADKLFDSFAGIVYHTYQWEKLVLVGFAETATAIGAALATKMDCFYIQTTREVIPQVEYLYFSEAHSHATEQKLIKDDIDRVITCIDRIIFIEDEVTTGNTIKNIIQIIENEYGKHKVKFSIASILNGMEEDIEQEFLEKQIGLHYVVKTEHSNYEVIAEQYENDGIYYNKKRATEDVSYQYKEYGNYVNARRVVESKQYLGACESLWEHISKDIVISEKKKILVLGTEEFMFPALLFALKLEELGNNVRFHATTRSPIVVSKDVSYPLHKRYELLSFYDSERVTFIYELNQYEECYILTDAREQDEIGKRSILHALKHAGNDNIRVIRWC